MFHFASTDDTPLRIMLVRHTPLLRRAVRDLLNNTSLLTVVAEVDSNDDAVHLCGVLHPDVILSGVRLPTVDPIKLARSLIDGIKITIPILVVTIHADPEYAYRAVQSGVAGYLGADIDAVALFSAIQAVRSGLMVMSAASKEMVFEHSFPISKGSDSQANLARLSSREQVVLDRMVHGLTNKEIGSSLGVGLRTVEMHIAHIVTKLGVRSRTEAIIKVLRSAERLDLDHGLANFPPETRQGVL